LEIQYSSLFLAYFLMFCSWRLGGPSTVTFTPGSSFSFSRPDFDPYCKNRGFLFPMVRRFRTASGFDVLLAATRSRVDTLPPAPRHRGPWSTTACANAFIAFSDAKNKCLSLALRFFASSAADVASAPASGFSVQGCST